MCAWWWRIWNLWWTSSQSSPCWKSLRNVETKRTTPTVALTNGSSKPCSTKTKTNSSLTSQRPKCPKPVILPGCRAYLHYTNWGSQRGLYLVKEVLQLTSMSQVLPKTSLNISNIFLVLDEKFYTFLSHQSWIQTAILFLDAFCFQNSIEIEQDTWQIGWW